MGVTGMGAVLVLKLEPLKTAGDLPKSRIQVSRVPSRWYRMPESRQLPMCNYPPVSGMGPNFG